MSEEFDPKLIELLTRSGYFDTKHYAKNAQIDFSDSGAAVRHYLTEGGRRGLSTSILFDSSYYLASNGDVADSGDLPLLHYLLHGKKEGRRPLLSRSPLAAKPVAPHALVWHMLAETEAVRDNIQRASYDSRNSVDIVIPVYRGFDDTLACIHSVLLTRNITPYRLVVIDDQSPEPELSLQLQTLAALGLIVLLRNPENLGFVGTANRGMVASVARDVILLNSDTEVFGDWIDRLRCQAYAQPRVASVTPFSNNATIFSYPYFIQSNNQEIECGFEELDRITSRVNRGGNTIVPTGVGFCFYIPRAAVDEIGTLNHDLFGKGYGEENDFCMRGIENGWINIAAFDVFVRHTGEVSFGANASAGKRDGARRLNAVHPRYEAMVGECIQRDAFRAARGRIDLGRFARASAGRGILMIEHGWGGGIERHVLDLAGMLAKDGIPSVICKPEPSGSGRALLSVPENDDFPNLPEIDWLDSDKAVGTLQALALGHVHIHSLIGMSDAVVSAMLAVIQAAGLAYDFTLHDYVPICPQITMIDWGGSYCDSRSETYCDTCIARSGTRFGSVDIREWRARYQRILNGARAILVPDQDVADRMASYVALTTPIHVRPHPAPSLCRPIPRPSSDIRTIGIIGAIGEHKGSRILRILCADALARRLPLRFVLYGYTDSDKDDFSNLLQTGRYKDADFGEVLVETPCDIALFLSVWPETFSYTLDHAFSQALYPVAFDIGAIARRIRATGFGETIPLTHMYEASLINDRLLAIDLSSTLDPVVEPDRAWTSREIYYALKADQSPNRTGSKEGSDRCSGE